MIYKSATLIIIMVSIALHSVNALSGSLSSEASGRTLTINCGSKPIVITSATYGPNCGAPANNQVPNLAAACDGLTSCSYKVDHGIIGDPAIGCAKTYTYTYDCADTLSAEASSKTLHINCGSLKIDISSATYGGNCGKPTNNVKGYLVTACEGHHSCSYRVDHTRIGDPAYGCAKTFVYSYSCSSNPDTQYVAAKTPSLGFIEDTTDDTGSWIESIELNGKYIFVVSLLLINFIGIICVYHRSQSKGKRSFEGKKYAVQFDEETDMEPINK